jgi:hypothetical protein
MGVWGAHASDFLVALGIGSLVLLAVPLIVAPLGWARILRWNIPGDTDLAVYFGRCLGAVACVLAGGALIAAGTPQLQPFFYLLCMSVFTLMIAIHIFGAWRGIQPLSESLETGVWLILLILAVLTYPLVS